MNHRPDENHYGDSFENTDDVALQEEYRRLRRQRQEALKRRRRQTYIFRFSVIAAGLMFAAGITAVCTGLFGQAKVAEPVNHEYSVLSSETSQPVTDTSTQNENIEGSEVSRESSEPHIEITPLKNDFTYAEISNKAAVAEKLTTEYVFLYDVTHDKVLYDGNGDKKCYPASTTKILTAIVAEKIIPKDIKITVGEEINLINEGSSVAYLNVGCVLDLEMLLQALLLPSGNDAAYVLAVNTARIYTGNDNLPYDEALEIFAQLMNDTAKQIGTTGTHFVVPDGFHDDDHYTTAKDLARIAAYADSIPIINKVCSTFAVNCESYSGEVFYWENTNSLIDPYSNLYNGNVKGMKTGFTDEAGTCLVAAAEVDGITLIAVLMKAESVAAKYDDTNLLFQVGFGTMGLSYYD